jgi:hypothetical protein
LYAGVRLRLWEQGRTWHGGCKPSAAADAPHTILRQCLVSTLTVSSTRVTYSEDLSGATWRPVRLNLTGSGHSLPLYHHLNQKNSLHSACLKKYSRCNDIRTQQHLHFRTTKPLRNSSRTARCLSGWGLAGPVACLCCATSTVQAHRETTSRLHRRSMHWSHRYKVAGGLSTPVGRHALTQRQPRRARCSCRPLPPTRRECTPTLPSVPLPNPILYYGTPCAPLKQYCTKIPPILRGNTAQSSSTHCL